MECGKEIRKNAEICPNCGCRVKSINLRITVICMIVVLIIICAIQSVKLISSRISIEAENDERQKNLLHENETIEKYLGTYRLIFSEGLFYADYGNKISKLKYDFDFSEKPKAPMVECKKCVVLDNPVSNENMFISPFEGLHVYIDDSSVAVINLSVFVEEGLKDTKEYVCFRFSGDDSLTQIECPDITKRNNSSLSTKYDFKLIRVN